MKTERPLVIDGRAFLIKAWPVTAGWRVAVQDADGRAASLDYQATAPDGLAASADLSQAVEGLMDLAEGELRTRLLMAAADEAED